MAVCRSKPGGFILQFGLTVPSRADRRDQFLMRRPLQRHSDDRFFAAEQRGTVSFLNQKIIICDGGTNMRSRNQIVAGALIALTMAASSAAAGEGHNRNVSVMTIVEFGNAVQPVVIDQSSRINIARVIEIGAGTVDATIIQDGMKNITKIVQVGTTANALIEQDGLSNLVNVRQVGASTNALIAQTGNLNTGFVSQFGLRNWLAIFQFSR